MAPKQKRKELTISEKFEIITFYEKNKDLKQKQVAKKFEIPSSTLSGLRKQSEIIKRDYEDNVVASKTKRKRKCKLIDVDNALLLWFKQMRTTNPEIPISGEMLQEQEQKFVDEFHLEDEIISPSWIERWKRRHSISSKKMCGESATVNGASVDEWRRLRIPEILINFSPSSIFNVSFYSHFLANSLT